MEKLPVYLFKNSFGPFVTQLNKHHMKYNRRQARPGIHMGPFEVLELLVQSKEIWGTVAAVVIAYLKYRPTRKVTITTKKNTVVQAEGLSSKQLEKVLSEAKSLTAIDTEKNDK